MTKSRNYHAYLALMLIVAFFLTAIPAATADPTCTAANYCMTELTLSKQKAPITCDGTGNWLNSFSLYFDADVKLTNGADSVPLTDAKMIYACSTDGITFGSCQTEPFIETGSYILRVSVEEDNARFYLPVYADAVLTLTEAQSSTALTITYQSGVEPTEEPDAASEGSDADILAENENAEKPAQDAPNAEPAAEVSPENEPVSDPTMSDEGRVTGSVVIDPTTYTVGDEAIILGNLGLDKNGNPDPLIKEGFQLTNWKDIETNEVYKPGAMVTMVRSLVLVPVWTSDADVAAELSAETESSVDEPFLGGEPPAPAPMPTVDPALLAKAVPFYPVTSNGADASPRFFIDGQAIAVPEAETSVNERHLLNGFYTPDGDPIAVAFGGVPVDPSLQSKDLANPGAAETGSSALQAKSPNLQAGANYDMIDWSVTNVMMPNTGFSTFRTSAAQAADPSALVSVNMKIEIPQFNVMSDIVQVPFTGENWDVASLRENVGLLEGFDLPGVGISMLAGHNHLGSDQVGPFVALGSLKNGDRIFIHRENKPLIIFEVYENRQLDPNDFATIEELVADQAGAIVLVTCENETTEGTYSDRRVVFAKMIVD